MATEVEKLRKEFDEARIAYFGIRRGLDTELANFLYHCRHPLRSYPVLKPSDVVSLLKPAIENQIKQRDIAKSKGKFVPPPKNFQTWINNRCWEEGVAIIKQLPKPKLVAVPKPELTPEEKKEVKEKARKFLADFGKAKSTGLGQDKFNQRRNEQIRKLKGK